MTHPGEVLSDATTAIQYLHRAIGKGGLPGPALELVHLRASQINGCAACLDAGHVTARKAGVTDEQLAALPAWREAPSFSLPFGLTSRPCRVSC